MVEASTGSTVAEIFAARGEEAFRAEESRVLAEARPLAGTDGGVGRRWLGAVAREPGAAGRLRRRVAARRPRHPGRPGGPGRGRPLLDDDPAGALRLDAVRRPLYEEVADVVVDVDELEPATVVDRILAATAFARSLP